jgi:osmotically-inducible protein OsmY
MGTSTDIREAVRAELTFAPLVEATDITVRTMNGQVALTGTVTSYPQYLEAAAAARRVAGVRNVRNHLAVVLPAAEYGRQREAAELAVAGLTGVRNVKDDIQISYDADPADVKWFVQDALDRRALVEDDLDVTG